VTERRKPHRQAHLAAVERARVAGEIVIAGAVGDPPHTGMLAFRGPDAAAAEAFAAADPYLAAGLVVRWSVQPWTVVTPLP
jgi:uncharacterized protein YciI